MPKLFKDITDDILGSHHIILLKWDERFLLDILLKRIKALNFSKSAVESGFTVFCAKDTKIQDIIALGEELPLFSGRKVIILRTLQNLKAEVRKALCAYLAVLPPFITLVMEEAKKTESQKSDLTLDDLGKCAKKHGVVIDCSLGKPELTEWLKKSFAQRGYEIKAEALHLLVKLLGEELDFLPHEIEKLELYAGRHKVITRNMVEALIMPHPSEKAYTLIKSLGQKHARESLSILKELFQDPDAGLGLLSYIGSFLKSMLQLKAWHKRFGNLKNLEQVVKLKPWQIDNNFRMSQNFTLQELRQGIELLCRVELAMKAGKDARLMLELFVMQLCGAKV